MEDFFGFEQLLAPEEKIARDSVRKFVDQDVIPLMADAYEQANFPQELIGKLASMGLFGMTLPAEFGGSDANYVTYGLVCQELERGDSGLRSFVSVQSSLCMYPIYAFGSEEHKQKWLAPMARGEVIGCFGLTEPDSGSDPGSMQTTAKKVDDGWELNGSKMWITNATIANIAIIWAKTSDGIRGFLVETNTPGFQAKEIKHKMSLRASITGEIYLQNCVVPAENMLPGTEKGLVAALKCLTQARYGIAWGAIGAAIECYDTALDYTKQRKQFNRPLASMQLIQKDLVDMLNEIVKTQFLNLQLGRNKDHDTATFAMVSLAKMNACKNALEICRKARNLLGGNGISLEYPIIRHMHNLETVFTYEGTDNIHHLIVGKEITGMDAF